jgi:alanyl-tRNA synthetase
MTVKGLAEKYISFFEKRGHKMIPGAPLVPENDPTTLFTSSGMQPLVPYLLGEPHPLGKRLVDVQNSFRAQDIDEIGDNRHTTFFRMLGNWSLGDYFKKDQLPWFFEFLINKDEGLGIDPKRLYVTVFSGYQNIPKDTESIEIWKEAFAKAGIEAKENEKIFEYGVNKNWWSRSGVPDKMPVGEIGGPDSEVFYDFGEELKIHVNSKYKNEKCHPNCECGRFLEIGNSVFIQYQKTEEGSFKELPQKNVDFGGGLERLLAAIENQPDIFRTTLFYPIVQSIQQQTDKNYDEHSKEIRIITNHLVSAVFIANENIEPSNKDQGYILRRLLRRAFDEYSKLQGKDVSIVIETIVEQYKETDPVLIENFERIKNVIIEEEQNYKQTLERAKSFIEKKYKTGDELKGVTEISAEDAFNLYQTHGLSPSQIKSMGYNFDEQEFARKMEEHQKISRAGAERKFSGGLADHSEEVIKGHTATHLLHQALRDVLGLEVYQTGSNITSERVRFDFAFDRKLTDEEIKKVEGIVNEKIKENLPVHFEMLDLQDAKKTGAIGLFEQKYQDKVKVYFMGDYSKELCGGPHVENTGFLKSFKITKEEGLGKGKRRVYAIVGAST